MIKLVQPTFEALSFREALLKDKETMSYNQPWGGTIDFKQNRWQIWYEKWIGQNNPHYFYRYVYDEKMKAYVGETAYHYEPETDRYLVDVIIHDAYRHRGYGGQALDLLCNEALMRGISILYDEIAVSNSSVSLFLKHGFTVEKITPEVVVVKKVLI